MDTEREFSIFVSIALLKLTEAVLPDYLGLVLNSPIGREQAAELTQGMANRNLVLRDLKQIRVPLAPVAEQRRIAGRLREQLDSCEIPLPPLELQREISTRIETEKKGVAELMKTLVEQLTALDHLPTALLLEAFNGNG